MKKNAFRYQTFSVANKSSANYLVLDRCEVQYAPERIKTNPDCEKKQIPLAYPPRYSINLNDKKLTLSPRGKKNLSIGMACKSSFTLKMLSPVRKKIFRIKIEGILTFLA